MLELPRKNQGNILSLHRVLYEQPPQWIHLNRRLQRDLLGVRELLNRQVFDIG